MGLGLRPVCKEIRSCASEGTLLDLRCLSIADSLIAQSKYLIITDGHRGRTERLRLKEVLIRPHCQRKFAASRALLRRTRTRFRGMGCHRAWTALITPRKFLPLGGIIARHTKILQWRPTPHCRENAAGSPVCESSDADAPVGSCSAADGAVDGYLIIKNTVCRELEPALTRLGLHRRTPGWKARPSRSRSADSMAFAVRRGVHDSSNRRRASQS